MPNHYYKKSHAMGLHAGQPHPACTQCTQDREAAAQRAAHAAGSHKKLPRQKCPDCRAARFAQVAS